MFVGIYGNDYDGANNNDDANNNNNSNCDDTRTTSQQQHHHYDDQVALKAGKASILTQAPDPSLFIGPGPDCEGIVFAERYCVVTMDACLPPSSVLWRITETFIEDDNPFGGASQQQQHQQYSPSRSVVNFATSMSSPSSPGGPRGGAGGVPSRSPSRIGGGAQSRRNTTFAPMTPTQSNHNSPNHSITHMMSQSMFSQSVSPTSARSVRHHHQIQKGSYQSWRFYNDDSGLTMTVTAKFRGARDSTLANNIFQQRSLIGLEASMVSHTTNTSAAFAALNAMSSVRDPTVRDRRGGTTVQFDTSSNSNAGFSTVSAIQPSARNHQHNNSSSNNNLLMMNSTMSVMNNNNTTTNNVTMNNSLAQYPGNVGGANNNNNNNMSLVANSSLARHQMMQQALKEKLHPIEITETIPPGATVHFFSGYVVGEVQFAFDAY